MSPALYVIIFGVIYLLIIGFLFVGLADNFFNNKKIYTIAMAGLILLELFFFYVLYQNYANTISRFGFGFGEYTQSNSYNYTLSLNYITCLLIICFSLLRISRSKYIYRPLLIITVPVLGYFLLLFGFGAFMSFSIIMQGNSIWRYIF